MASFSRMQLAAALLEYDNDSDNANAPRKSAYDSAIFARLRNANGNIHAHKEPKQRDADYLGVSLPSETGGAASEVMNKDLSRRSKAASIDMLHNPFGEDEEEEPEGEIEVDLASWGLDSLIPDKRESKSAKGKEKARSVSSLAKGGAASTLGISHSRSQSVPLAELEETSSLLDARPDYRRNSISNPLDLADERPYNAAPLRQRTFSMDRLSARPNPHSLASYERKRDTIPFPSTTSNPGLSEVDGPSGFRPASLMDVHSASAADESNPFAIPPPPPSRASRFDPKSVAHARTFSTATRLSKGPQMALDADGQSSRAPSRASPLDMRSTRDRRMSTATMRTRDMLDDDYQSAYAYDAYEEEGLPASERRYSRLELMRPKVLVMPSPLQGASMRAPMLSSKPTPEGFLDSSDGRPLPPGARSSRMSSLGSMQHLSVPVASNSFTPNPRLSLSASQLLFRNTLMVDGQRDVTYSDIDANIERAIEEGEQVKMPEQEDDQAETQQPVAPPEASTSRPPGKLFGRSLIDDLEARKAEMRNKKRVFTGDQRPSMMDRPEMKRSSTLIDPSSLAVRPPLGDRMASTQTDTILVRRGSRSSKPLLAIDDAGHIAETSTRETTLAQTRSVFGVDTLWAREMVKLKEIEAEERANVEERRRIEEEEEAKEKGRKKKKGKKGKKKDKTERLEIEQAQSRSPEQSTPASAVAPSANEANLLLPDIPVVTSRRRVARVPVDDGSDYESSASEATPMRSSDMAHVDEAVDQWVSDDEKKPVPVSARVRRASPRVDIDDDSDEDIPLSMTLEKVTRKLSLQRHEPDEDSDEDKPLSTLLNQPRLNVPSIDFDHLGNSQPGIKADGDDEDNEPLAIRASRLPPGVSQLSGLSGLSAGGLSVGNNGDEDDRPLSMHPGQIRKSQFQMFAQVQQMQQQAQIQQQMFQAQMAFGAPPSMMYMMPPAPFTSQTNLPVQENKFNSVDKWRHGVAVEGSTT